MSEIINKNDLLNPRSVEEIKKIFYIIEKEDDEGNPYDISLVFISKENDHITKDLNCYLDEIDLSEAPVEKLFELEHQIQKDIQSLGYMVSSEIKVFR